jgi:hypothetical protein
MGKRRLKILRALRRAWGGLLEAAQKVSDPMSQTAHRTRLKRGRHKVGQTTMAAANPLNHGVSRVFGGIADITA